MKYLYLFAASISVFVICCKPKEYRGETMDNIIAKEWLSSYIPETEKSDWGKKFEEIPFIIISDEYRDLYIEKLKDKQYCILDGEDFFLLTGKVLEKEYGLAIRGVHSLHYDKSYHIIEIEENEYLVLYIGDRVYLNKTVLIIELDELPENIYIRISPRA
jgi:hypothetical protein